MMVQSRLACAALVMGVVFVGATAAANVTVYANPVWSQVEVGELFTLEIKANIPANEPIVGWGLDLDIEFPSVLARTGTAPEIGPAWDSAFSIDGDALAALSPFPPGTGISGNVLLATLEFEALAVGETDLLLGDDCPADLTEGFSLDPDGAEDFAAVTYVPGHIVVVPEPASMLLLLVGGVWLSRRHRFAR